MILSGCILVLRDRIHVFFKHETWFMRCIHLNENGPWFFWLKETGEGIVMEGISPHPNRRWDGDKALLSVHVKADKGGYFLHFGQLFREDDMGIEYLDVSSRSQE